MTDTTLQEPLTTGTASLADAGELLSLINSIQPHVPWNLDHLRWQYFHLPRGQAHLYVIRSQDAIVSLYVAVPQTVSAENQPLEGWMIQDVMTRPDFRGRGFLHQLGALCLEDLSAHGAVGYTFPNELSEKSFRRNGWIELCAVPARSAAVPASPARASSSVIQPWSGPFDATATEIWESSGMEFGVRRDDSYLNWRYQKPGAVYHRFRIAAGRGLLVLKLYTDGECSTLHILELLVKEANRDVIPDVLRFCFEFAAEQRAETITAWLPGRHPYAPFFDAAGLMLSPVRRRFVFITHPAAMSHEIRDSGRWHLTQGDSDVY